MNTKTKKLLETFDSVNKSKSASCAFSDVEDFLDCYNQPKFMNKNPVDYWKNSECKYFLEQAVKLLEKVVEKKKLLSSFED